MKGIILVLSCQKYLNTRVEKNFSNFSINDWGLVIVCGDPFIDQSYIFNKETRLLTIKCEDSYLHTCKKRILGIKFVKEIFNIEEGILCCGDDILFHKNSLINYLDGEKVDFEGKNLTPGNYKAENREKLKKTINDLFMYNYYHLHPEDFNNPRHGLKYISIDYLKSVCKRPNLIGPAGTIFYLSINCCDILVNHMESINFNIFHYDEFTNSYPYIIEDCAVSFILYYHDIDWKNNQLFFTHDINNINALCYTDCRTWHHVPEASNLVWRY